MKENVGDALTEALAFVARSKPADPIEELGHYLLKFAANKEETIEILREDARADEEISRVHENALAEEKTNDGDTKVQENDIVERLRSTDDVLSILPEVLAHVREISGASSAYVGRRESGGEGEESDFIKYIAAAPGDENVLERYLRPSEGVTFEAWKRRETEEKEEEETNDDADAAVEKTKERSPVHVPNVLRDDRIQFFGEIPTFGSYLAMPCEYKSCCNRESLEKLLAAASSDTKTDEEEGESKDTGAEGKSDENASSSLEFAASTFVSRDVDLVLCLDTLANNVPGGFDSGVVDKVRSLSKEIAAAFERSDLRALRSDADIIAAEENARKSIEVVTASAEDGLDESVAKAEEASAEDEEGKRLAVALVRLERASRVVDAARKEIVALCSRRVAPDTVVVDTLLAFLHAFGVDASAVSDLNKLSWSKLSSRIASDAAPTVESFDVGSVSDASMKSLRERLADSDASAVHERSAAAGVLAKWLRAVVEARDAQDAKKAATAAAAAAAEEEKEAASKEEAEDA